MELEVLVVQAQHPAQMQRAPAVAVPMVAQPVERQRLAELQAALVVTIPRLRAVVPLAFRPVRAALVLRQLQLAALVAAEAVMQPAAVAASAR